MPAEEIEIVYKKDEEAFDVRVDFENTNPAITYEIASLSVTAEDQNGTDATSILINDGNNSFSGKRAIAWIQGGTSGLFYFVDITATMTTGQIITKRLKVVVSD